MIYIYIQYTFLWGDLDFSLFTSLPAAHLHQLKTLHSRLHDTFRTRQIHQIELGKALFRGIHLGKTSTKSANHRISQPPLRCCFSSWVQYDTPPKINMEPENGGLVQMVFLFKQVIFRFPCEFFWSVLLFRDGFSAEGTRFVTVTMNTAWLREE